MVYKASYSKYGFGSLKFLLFLCKNPNLKCEFSPTVTPRDGNCLLHAIMDGVLNNEGFRHTDGGTDEWTVLLKDLKFYDNTMDEVQHIQFIRNRWVLGASEWLAGNNGSKENDQSLLGYSNKEWNYIWATMIENGAWDVPSVKDRKGNFLKENQAPEMMIKYIAHDLQCNIIIFDLFNNTVEFCSGNQLLDHNIKFNSPLLLYTTGSHFQSLLPTNHDFFIRYAIELQSKYFGIPCTNKAQLDRKKEDKNMKTTKENHPNEQQTVTIELKPQRKRNPSTESVCKEELSVKKTKIKISEEERKLLHRESQRRYREKQSQDEEKKTERMKIDAERKKKKREIENETEQIVRKKVEAEMKRKKRENIERRKLDNEVKRKKRENETEKKSIERRKLDAEVKRKKIEAESVIENFERKEQDAKNKRKNREAESVNEKQNRINKVTEQNKKRIKNEDTAGKNVRNKKEKQRKLEKIQVNENRAREVDVSKFQEYSVQDSIDVDTGNLNGGKKCLFCQAFLLKKESSSFCCSNGKVDVVQQQKLRKLPKQLLKQFENEKLISNIRQYNNVMAMASLGTDHKPEIGPNFKIQGKLSHKLGSLLPESNQSPKFAQIYFHDTDQETSHRMNLFPQLDNKLIQTLQTSLHSINSYVRSFKSALDLGRMGEYKLCLIADRNKIPKSSHRRTFNLPQGCEVVALLPGEAGNLDIILTTKGGKLRRINQLHRSYDPLHYVLMFPYGEDGYQLGLKRNGGKTLSPKDFYCYRLQIRDLADRDHLMHLGKLTQQYFVDMQAKIEYCRIKWVSDNQHTIRSEKYQGLLDAVSMGDGNDIGRKIILPPTITGSPRWYAERFQDAMTMVREFGKPDYFLTFTCNPTWKEIKESLKSGENVYDRPDVSARVFKGKLDSLMKMLLQEHILGRVEAYFYSIEWQKRKGLPHAHILIIMEKDSKPKTVEAIDKVVCAEIPDKDENPKLYDIIIRNNLHGPCGKLFDEKLYCQEKTIKGRIYCTKEFPKDCQKETLVVDGGYPVYRRRSQIQGGHFHLMERKKKVWTVDNSWVIPYSPFLSLVFDAHINVEVVHTVRAVKYIYKYITKGPDRAIFKVEGDTCVNEVEDFLTGRYLGAGEASWKIYGFALHDKSHTIEKLPCHLENEQNVNFSEEDKAEELIQIGPPVTKLTAFFSLNQEDETARDKIYPDIPKFYVWAYGTKQWKKRQRGGHKVIGRIPSVGMSATQMERYCLRLLLFKRPGPTSFEDLRTVDGILHESFQAACYSMGFLEDDEENDRVMEEASLLSFGKQLIDCFVNLLLFSTPAQPKEFYMRHKDSLVGDFLKAENGIVDNAEANVLELIDSRLQYENKSLSFFGLPPIENRRETPALILDETSYDKELLANKTKEHTASMNIEQKNIFNNVVQSIEKEQGRIFCLNAPGGTGKTFVLDACLAAVRSTGGVAIATAISALAATLLQNGTTLHSRGKIPIPILEASVCNFGRNDVTGKLFRMCKLLIIDEVTMGDKWIYEALDRSLRDVRKNERLFGGITVLFAGDWRQTLPIVPRGSRSQIIHCCLKNSYIWKNTEVFTLQQNMRANLTGSAEAKEFSDFLLSVGYGTLCDSGGWIQLDPNYFSQSLDLTNFCDEVFDGINEGILAIDGKAILCPTNAEVKEVNKIVLNMLDGEAIIYLSNDSLLDDTTSHQYPTEFLNSIDIPSMPSHSLEIKKNAIVMLLVNLDQKNGHCNGTRYQVINASRYVIEAVALNGKADGKKLLIPRIKFISNASQFPFQLRRKQFPIRLSYAITANKSQGQTLKFVGIYLGTEFFSHGQVYIYLHLI